MIAPMVKIIPLIGVYFIYLTTFALAGGAKFVEGKVPEWFSKQFESSFLAKFPGVGPCYWTIAILESVVALLVMVSLFRLEFTMAHPVFLQLAVGIASIIFGILAFGQRLVADFAGAANSFFYFAATLVTQLYLMKL